MSRPTPAGPGEDIARYLELFSSQVAVCAQESEEPVATLVQSMLAVAESAREMLAVMQSLPGPANAALRAIVERNCVALLERVQLSVVAFQFHDLLTQRLQHIHGGLAELAQTLRDPGQRNTPEYWSAVGTRIRERYSLTEQRTLFDELVNGVTASNDTTAPDPPTGYARVELF